MNNGLEFKFELDNEVTIQKQTYGNFTKPHLKTVKKVFFSNNSRIEVSH